MRNRDIIKQDFKMENVYIYPVCANVFLGKRQNVEPDKMQNCLRILKENTGVFSNFRGNGRIPMLSMLALDSAPEEKFRKALTFYSKLKDYFWGSEYLAVASMIVTELVDETRYEEVAERTRKIYEIMKAEHPFLTSSEDSVFASLLALSDKTEAEMVREVEACYNRLKPDFFSGNAVQSLSHVLALGEGSVEDKCKRVMDIFYALREKGCKYGTDYQLATLGALALLPVDIETLVDEMIDVDIFLSGQKGYGFFGIEKRTRIMHAAMIVSTYHTDQNDNNLMGAAALSGSIALVAAQQAAMCAAIAASGAAAASAGN
ncbi:MAG: DUF4003 family protein [Lachnospiraceae bacterium]|nr:DUF4003 family protein [Lachnospiraceae bacterium]